MQKKTAPNGFHRNVERRLASLVGEKTFDDEHGLESFVAHAFESVAVLDENADGRTTAVDHRD